MDKSKEGGAMMCRYHKRCGHYQNNAVTCNDDSEAIVYCGVAKKLYRDT